MRTQHLAALSAVFALSLAHAWDGEPGPIEPGSEGAAIYIKPIDPQRPKAGLSYSKEEVTALSTEFVVHFLKQYRKFGVLANMNAHAARPHLYSNLLRYFKDEAALGATLPEGLSDAVEAGVKLGIERAAQH
ncbi:hypothetical protein N8I74_08330 [Chitiniphilus purpureus]|uniref:Uncharacterized protein n=1 Tax=Chitiniphilus purpureus TaxID=2981137 RepID=A0ABY6DRP7_9NEIS|nr:hypothetical protein [Chitiniphilus sp. CD1]UXY17002.1 hypothetical protein N8I74_08330 [Chitiniphilus sp. CD1]